MADQNSSSFSRIGATIFGQDPEKFGESVTEDEAARVNRYKGELSGYHKPFYMIGPLGSSEEVYKKTIVENILRLERASGMLTDSVQRKAMADSLSTVITNHDMAFPAAVGLAAYMAMKKNKRDTLAFPLVGGSKSPDSTVFPPRPFASAFGFPTIRGPPATFIWHFLRVSAYLGAIYLTLVPPYQIMVKVRGLRDMKDHPALKDITQAADNNLMAMAAKQRAERIARAARIVQKDTDEQSLHPRMQSVQDSANQSQQRLGEPERQHKAQAAQSQEAGSGAGADTWSSATYSTTDQQSSSPSSWDSPPSSTEQQQRGFFQRPAPRQPPPPPPQGETSGAQAPSWGSSSAFNDSMGSGVFEDDSSPVTPSHRAKQPGGGQQHAATSWEEIRRRSMQGQQGRQQPHAPQGAEGSGDQDPSSGQEGQYTYGETDKDKAQKEFDAMLAAERKGSGGGNWKRW